MNRGWQEGPCWIAFLSSSGETRFPHTPAPAAYFHVSHPCGCATQRRHEHTFVLGRAAPSQTLPRVGEWGNPVSPHPSPRASVHVSHPCGCAAHRRDEHTSWEGCALPDPPAGGGWGNPVSPCPCGAGAWGHPVSPHPSPRAYVHVSHPCGCAAPRRHEHTVVPGMASPSHTLPPGGGMGTPGFPMPLPQQLIFTLALTSLRRLYDALVHCVRPVIMRGDKRETWSDHLPWWA